MKHGMILGAAIFVSSASWAASDLGSQVVDGKQLFETTCAASTCHGSAGAGAGGPKLAGRNFSLEFVRTTLRDGRPGTAMPSFKDLFDPDMMASVIAYVLNISTGGRWATAVPVEKTDDGKAVPSAAWPESVAIGKDTGSPAAGYALFYDATRAESCRTCHSYKGNGGPVGPDFATLRHTPLEIFAAISKPGAANADHPAVTVTHGEDRVSGIKGVETDDVIRVIDVSALPPVTRSFRKSDRVTVTPLKDEKFFDHGPLGYTPQELRDAAAFLGMR